MTFPSAKIVAMMHGNRGSISDIELIFSSQEIHPELRKLAIRMGECLKTSSLEKSACIWYDDEDTISIMDVPSEEAFGLLRSKGYRILEICAWKSEKHAVVVSWGLNAVPRGNEVFGFPEEYEIVTSAFLE